MTVDVSNPSPLSTVACELVVPDVGSGKQVTDFPGSSPARSRRKFLRPSSPLSFDQRGLRAESGGSLDRQRPQGSWCLSGPGCKCTQSGGPQLRGCFELRDRRGGGRSEAAGRFVPYSSQPTVLALKGISGRIIQLFEGKVTVATPNKSDVTSKRNGEN